MLGTLGRGELWFVRDRVGVEWAIGRFDLQTARFELVNLGVEVGGDQTTIMDG